MENVTHSIVLKDIVSGKWAYVGRRPPRVTPTPSSTMVTSAAPSSRSSPSGIATAASQPPTAGGSQDAVDGPPPPMFRFLRRANAAVVSPPGAESTSGSVDTESVVPDPAPAVSTII
jgi:hypothetical protein